MENIDISGLDQISKLSDIDKLLIGTADGNKSMNISDVMFEVIDQVADYPLRKTIFRGNNLGSVVTDEQWAAIEDGTFKGIFLGDYWEIGGRFWFVTDINYWRTKGSTLYTKYHLVIMPLSVLYNGKINVIRTVEGGYANSNMVGTGLNNAKTIIDGAFGADHIYKHQELLSNSVTDGVVSGVSWFDRLIDIPNSNMVLGSRMGGSRESDGTSGNIQTLNINQLMLMMVYPTFQVGRTNGTEGRENWWLRDVATNSAYYSVNYSGSPSTTYVDVESGVRPVFGICA